MRFAGKMWQFSGIPLAAFAPSVRSNLPRSQVGRSMFSRAYSYAVAPNLLARQFDVAQPDTVWVGDITYV